MQGASTTAGARLTRSASKFWYLPQSTQDASPLTMLGVAQKGVLRAVRASNATWKIWVLAGVLGLGRTIRRGSAVAISPCGLGAGYASRLVGGRSGLPADFYFVVHIYRRVGDRSHRPLVLG